MILYHLTKDLTHNGKFVPRVPKSRMVDEDEITKRICVATSIEGCLTALPVADGVDRNDMCLSYKVFRIDTDKLNLHQSVIMDSKTLFEGYVEDALFTGEHWILESFSIDKEDSFFIELESFDRDSSAPIINYMELEELVDFIAINEPDVYHSLKNNVIDMMYYFYDGGIYESYFGETCNYFYPVSEVKYRVLSEIK